MRSEEFEYADTAHLEIQVPRSMVGAVYLAVAQLLGATSVGAIAAAASGGAGKAEAAPAPRTQPADTNSQAVEDDVGHEDASVGAANDGAVDAGGWAWSPELHASTKGVTKDGYWRMKVGVSRPDPKPGFPKSDGITSTASTGAELPAPDTATGATAGRPEDEDEFAAFRAAADKSNATDAAAAASVPARKWTDADLGALCNQAAVKLGDPAPVKAIIEEYTAGTGQVPHSRNIPDDKRGEFAKAVEAKAGIEFAG